MAPANDLTGDADPDTFADRVRAALPPIEAAVARRDGWLEVRVGAADVLPAAKALRDADLGLNMLTYVTGVDEPEDERVDVLYHFHATQHPDSVMLRTYAPYAEPTVSSITPAWPAASWHERETTDMFLVEFAGHPDPRPLMLDVDEPCGALLKRVPVREPADIPQRFAERLQGGKRLPFRLRPVRDEVDATPEDGAPA